MMDNDRNDQDMNQDQSLFDFFEKKPETDSEVPGVDEALEDQRAVEDLVETNVVETNVQEPETPATDNVIPQPVEPEEKVEPSGQTFNAVNAAAVITNTISPQPAKNNTEHEPVPVKAPAPANEKGKKNRLFGKNKNKPAEIQISCGKYLKDARLASGLSLEEVEEQTKIRKIYVSALENEDFNNLPPIVFVCAYIKTLSKTYNIAPENAQEMLEQFKQLLPTHLGEDTISHLAIDREIDEDEERKLKLLLISGIAAIALIFVTIVIFAFISLSSDDTNSHSSDSQEKFDPGKISQLAPDQFIKMKELPFKLKKH